jgi:hypothetical protein
MDRKLIDSITRASWCSSCRARIGIPCTDTFGVPMIPPHPSRQKLAAERFPKLAEAIAAAAQEMALAAAAEKAAAQVRKEKRLHQTGRTSTGQFAPGASGNPSGRPRKGAKIQKLQEQLSQALETLTGSAGPLPPAAKVSGAMPPPAAEPVAEGHGAGGHA